MTTLAARPGRLIDNPDLLRERLRAAPDTPGVYLMRDMEARVAYVGKASSLRNRLRSYFSGIESHPDRTRQLVERVFDFEAIPCESEREALILENLLIKRHRPRFNVRLKDDKNYLYLKIPRVGQRDAIAPGTAREEERVPRGEAAHRAMRFPRPYYTRRMARDGARYFGPYTSAQSLRSTVRSLRSIFPFRTCSDEIFKRGRVCLDYHIKRCSGPCQGFIGEEAYNRLLDDVELFMAGRSDVLVEDLTTQMADAAERLDYELAARHRDRLRAIERIRERQNMLLGSRDDEDAVAVVVEGGRAMAGLLAVRQGRVQGVETHELEGAVGVDEGDVLASFVGQFYGDTPSVPRTVLLGAEVTGREVLADFLAAQRGGPVALRVPQRGSLRGLVEQARDAARSALAQARIVGDYDGDHADALLADLQERLDLPQLPRRIECYDISNTMGTNSVGSMVVFQDGRPRPDQYRHFGIKTVEGSDDFASMRETLRRRFARYLRSENDVPLDDPAGSNGGERAGEALTPQEAADALGEEGAAVGGADGGPSGTGRAPGSGTAGEASTGAGGDEAVRDALAPGPDPGAPARRRRASGRARVAAAEDSFGVLPDLVIIDGGKGQLAAAVEVLTTAGMTDIPLTGLAKRNEELFLPERPDPVVLPRDSPTLFLVQRVRDEAHRFAITKHRARRSKAALRSKLDVVPGLGPVRRRALLRRFGSIEGIRSAGLEDLESVPGIPRAVALRIKELL